MLDNYDSFTYNLVQYLGELGQDLKVYRNDKITINEIEALKPERIVISPGPCTPSEAGISIDVIKHFAGKAPILGVCLGHQCLAAALGGRVTRAARPRHGKTSPIHHSGEGLFTGVPSPFLGTRYHSLIVEREGLPEDLEVAAVTPEDEIMALRHRRWPLWGVQFHPESVLTEHGHALLRNFLEMRADA
jgi:anthranilate synthase/aminodeoxychorismate synthase-like glutamine amidotransferase